MNYFDEIDDIYYTSFLRNKVVILSDKDNYIKITNYINFLSAMCPTRRELPLLDFLKLLLCYCEEKRLDLKFEKKNHLKLLNVFSLSNQR